MSVKIDESGVAVISDGKHLSGFAHPCAVIEVLGIDGFKDICNKQGNINPKWVNSIIQLYKRTQKKLKRKQK